MKRLYLVRHSKSDQDDPSVTDFNRPLNKRGHADAPAMASILRTRAFIPEHIVSSPANRAKNSAEYFNKEFQSATIEYDKSLYHGDIDDIINVCIKLNNSVQSVMLVGHNPGITFFANVICDANIGNVPTTGILVIDVDTEDWQDMDMSRLKLIDFLFPKMNDT